MRAARCIGAAGRAFGALLAAFACASGHAAAHPGLRFDDVFRGEVRGPLHYRAEFGPGATKHHLEAWVAQDRRLKRVTDNAVETHAERRPGDAEYEMTVLDLKRRIATRIARTNLFRIGNFTDWFDLAHGLRHPRGEYLLVRGTPPAQAPRPLRSCEWYDLSQQGHTTHVCWSAAETLPLLVVSEQGQVLWRVTAVDHDPVGASTFAIRDAGFVRNDANRDIEAD